MKLAELKKIMNWNGLTNKEIIQFFFRKKKNVCFTNYFYTITK